MRSSWNARPGAHPREPLRRSLELLRGGQAVGPPPRPRQCEGPLAVDDGVAEAAPNLALTARTLDVDRDELVLWVSIHEITHAVQFSAAPWLRDHQIPKEGVSYLRLYDYQYVTEQKPAILRRFRELLGS